MKTFTLEHETGTCECSPSVFSADPDLDKLVQNRKGLIESFWRLLAAATSEKPAVMDWKSAPAPSASRPAPTTLQEATEGCPLSRLVEASQSERRLSFEDRAVLVWHIARTTGAPEAFLQSKTQIARRAVAMAARLTTAELRYQSLRGLAAHTPPTDPRTIWDHRQYLVARVYLAAHQAVNPEAHETAPIPLEQKIPVTRAGAHI